MDLEENWRYLNSCHCIFHYTHTSSDCQLPARHYSTKSTYPFCNAECQSGTHAKNSGLDLPIKIHNLQLYLFELEVIRTPNFRKFTLRANSDSQFTLRAALKMQHPSHCITCYITELPATWLSEQHALFPQHKSQLPCLPLIAFVADYRFPTQLSFL